jgi:hypothetical protein
MVPLSYPMLSEGRGHDGPTAVHEPKQLLAEYGDRLICVRYRSDAQRKKRMKTVELVVAERDWKPRPPPFSEDRLSACGSLFQRQHSAIA